MKKLIFIFIAAAAVTACTAVTKPSAAATLDGTQWQLNDENVQTTVMPTLNFADGIVSGNASCNLFSGSYSAIAATGLISFGNLAKSEKFCFGNNGVEENYLEAMKNANKYVLNGDILELYKDNILLLKFKKL